MSDPVDLKCEETLKESPPPRSVSATHAPTTTTIGSEGSTFSVFVRKFDPQSTDQGSSASSTNRSSEIFGGTGLGSSYIKPVKLESPKPPQQSYVSPFIQPSFVYAPVTKLLQPHTVISSMFAGSGGYPFDQSYHSLIKNVSPVKLPAPEIDQHTISSSNLCRDSSSLLTVGSKTNLPKVISLPSMVPRSQPQKSSPATTDTKPVTLHINTGKGTTVVQLQQSTAVSPSSKPIPVTPKRSITTGTISEASRSSFVVAPSSAISSIQSLPSRIFPSPISLPPTAAAAYLYQDQISAYHTLASLHNINAKLSSPISMQQSSSLPFVVGGGGGSGRTILSSNVSDSPLLHTRIVGSPLKPHSSPGTYSSSPTTVTGGSGCQGAHSNNGSSTIAGTPGQSPRPSILRKRPSDVNSTSGSTVPHGSVVKKLTYELLAATPRKTDVPTTVDEVVISTTRAPEHPDAGNSNHSSSASTISASSAIDGHSNSSYPETNTVRSLSPSPRKRPRKQRLDDLPEGGSGELDSEDERLSTETIAASESHGEFQDVKPVVRSEEYFAGIGLLSEFIEPLKSRPVKIELLDEVSSKITRKPRPSLWASCETAWQPRRNHFLQYDDVKSKEEKKPGMTEICSQKQIWQKIEGWRLHMISAHVDDLDKCEQTNLDDLDLFLRTFEAQNNAADGGMDTSELDSLKETILTSVQRCKAVKEQLIELKKPLHSILKHKRVVETIVQKYSVKRPSRKKGET